MTNDYEGQAAKPEELLTNEGLIPVLHAMNDSMFKEGIITEQTHLENFDRITEAERQQKQKRKGKANEQTEPNDAQGSN